MTYHIIESVDFPSLNATTISPPILWDTEKWQDFSIVPNLAISIHCPLMAWSEHKPSSRSSSGWTNDSGMALKRKIESALKAMIDGVITSHSYHI